MLLSVDRVSVVPAIQATATLAMVVISNFMSSRRKAFFLRTLVPSVKRRVHSPTQAPFQTRKRGNTGLERARAWHFTEAAVTRHGSL